MSKIKCDRIRYSKKLIWGKNTNYFSCSNVSKKNEERCLGGATVYSKSESLFERKTASARKSKSAASSSAASSSADPITNDWVFKKKCLLLLVADDFEKEINFGSPHICEYKYQQSVDQRNLYHTLKVR